jgi:hypothetical protein
MDPSTRSNPFYLSCDEKLARVAIGVHTSRTAYLDP